MQGLNNHMSDPDMLSLHLSYTRCESSLQVLHVRIRVKHFLRGIREQRVCPCHQLLRAGKTLEQAYKLQSYGQQLTGVKCILCLSGFAETCN